MSEKEYLDYILKELQKKIVQMKKRIGDVNKDMEDMNDYLTNTDMKNMIIRLHILCVQENGMKILRN